MSEYNNTPQEPLRVGEWTLGECTWQVKDLSFVVAWYVIQCGDMFYLGFSSKQELLRALWTMPMLFENPQEDIPNFVHTVWEWIEYDE